MSWKIVALIVMGMLIMPMPSYGTTGDTEYFKTESFFNIGEEVLEETSSEGGTAASSGRQRAPRGEETEEEIEIVEEKANPGNPHNSSEDIEGYIPSLLAKLPCKGILGTSLSWVDIGFIAFTIIGFIIFTTLLTPFIPHFSALWLIILILWFLFFKGVSC